MSENAHANGSTRLITPARAESGGGRVVDEQDEQFDAPTAILRLLIGGLLTGADELHSRLERWEDIEHATPPMSPPQYESEFLHYALIGLLFETQTRARKRFSTMLARLVRVSDEAEYLFTTTLAPVLRQTPLNPALMRLDEILFTGMVAVDRWTARGWLEELQGRRLAQRAAVSMVDEMLEYLAHNPEVRKLIEEQGVSVAEEAATTVRERTASADMWIERLARNLLRRPLSDGTVAASGLDAAPTNDTGG